MNLFKTRGVALIELSLVIPLLILLTLGAFEIHRFLSIDYYLRTAGYRLMLWTSMNTQSTFVASAFDTLMAEGAQYNMSTAGGIAVSRLHTGNVSNTILNTYSRGNITPIPTNYPNLFQSGLPITVKTIVVEITYNYTPLFYSFAARTIRHTYCCDYRGSGTF